MMFAPHWCMLLAGFHFTIACERDSWRKEQLLLGYMTDDEASKNEQVTS